MTPWRPLLVAAGVVVVTLPALRRDDGGARFATVREGPFHERLMESGTIAAAHVATYSAPVGSAQSKIVELAAEGTAVKAGDAVLRFDTSALEVEVSQELATRQTAEVERARAREEVRLAQVRSAADRQSARERVTLAERALADIVDGAGRVDAAQADLAAQEATREAGRADKARDDSEAAAGRRVHHAHGVRTG